MGDGGLAGRGPHVYYIVKCQKVARARIKIKKKERKKRVGNKFKKS